MKISPHRAAAVLLLLAALLAPSANGRAEESTGTEMVEFEVRFAEAPTKQVFAIVDAIRGYSQPVPGPATPSEPSPFLTTGVITADQTSQVFKALKEEQIAVTTAPRAATLTGRRAHVLNVREFRYPTKYSGPDKQGNMVPLEFQTAPVGIQLYFEPKIESENAIALSISMQIMRLTGFADKTTASKSPAPPPSNWEPVFKTSEVTTEITMAPGQTVIFSTAGNGDGAKEDFIFVTARMISSQ